MKSRERILQRLRGAPQSGQNNALIQMTDEEIFSDYKKADIETLFEQFKERLTALNGEVFSAANNSEAAKQLSELIGTVEEGKCIVQKNEFIEAVVSNNKSLSQSCDSFDHTAIDGRQFAQYAVGISTADFLAARTGSIILRSTSAAGRRLSVLPPMHIVLAKKNQLVPSLEEALNRIENDRLDWSFATIITGPSRTADIQKNLVLGAHGPKRLAVIILDS